MQRLGDWRLPLIFAVPVLVLATVGYLALQPVPGSGQSGDAVSLTIHENVTPRPAQAPTPSPTLTSTSTAKPSESAVPTQRPGITQFYVVLKPVAGGIDIATTDSSGRYLPQACGFVHVETAVGAGVHGVQLCTGQAGIYHWRFAAPHGLLHAHGEFGYDGADASADLSYLN